MIPDAILLQDIPSPTKTVEKEDSNVIRGTIHNSWYRGQVYYGIKSMVLQGSTAWRCIVELGLVLEQEYTTVPPRIYCYTDGGGDRRMTFLQVQLAVIAMFLFYNLDEIIAARTAAGCSFRNPVERCRCVANLGLQGIGLMREKMVPEMEKIMSTCNSNADIRNISNENRKFEGAVSDSIQPTKGLIEEVLQRLSLKNKPFKIFQPATEEDILKFKQVVIDKFKHMPTTVDTLLADFFQNHCVKRTYFFR